MITWMKNMNNFQRAEVEHLFQSGVGYKSVAYKNKRVILISSASNQNMYSHVLTCTHILHVSKSVSKLINLKSDN